MKKQLSVLTMACALALLGPVVPILAQSARDTIADSYKWDLSHIYASENDWRNGKDEVAKLMEKVPSYKGRLTKSATVLLECLELNTQISKQASRLAVYVGMNADIDTRNTHYQALQKELRQMFTDFGAQTAFINPEILSVDWKTIEKFIKKEPGLKVYEKMLMSLFRQKEHVLSDKEEAVLALTSLIMGAPASTYNIFANAEMPAPDVVLSDGQKVALDNAGYSKYRASANRADRQLVFDAYWGNWKKFEATMGELMGANVKEDVFGAKSRRYESSLQAALQPNEIPESVYLSLVENVNKNLPAFHRYLRIKARMLGVDTLHYSDMYAPVTGNVTLTYPYDTAKPLVLDALKSLGPDYVSVVEKAFNERWVDVYPTPGKRSGAYSNGGAFDVHPYILLNYNDQYNEVSTLAHELGHTMHSYYSNKTQPYPLARYSIFNAEVASTFNEVLLFESMRPKVTDDTQRLALLMDWLDRFKGTLFRQTQFAEFELAMHQMGDKGQPITGSALTKLYGDILKKYYGHDQGVCVIDKNCDMEWAFIPHFYRSFYVYQYSTSFTASISLAADVLAQKPGALERYKAFLASGSTKYPIELLQDAGVDMTTSQPFETTIAAMNRVMDEIEAILDKSK
ncbi:MAG: oligoendopeptidase F [Breznakibacter sp.]